MQFMLSVHHGDDNAVPTDVPIEQLFADVDAFNQELIAADQLVFAGGLQPASTAIVVDALDADDPRPGPYLTGEEYLGGFWVVRAADIDTAVGIGRRASAACRQPIEVRPFQDEE